MSALGQKLPRRLIAAVSALPPKAAAAAAAADQRVRFGPISDIPLESSQRLRHGAARACDGRD
jgi:hypothetical protein